MNVSLKKFLISVFVFVLAIGFSVCFVACDDANDGSVQYIVSLYINNEKISQNSFVAGTPYSEIVKSLSSPPRLFPPDSSVNSSVYLDAEYTQLLRYDTVLQGDQKLYRYRVFTLDKTEVDFVVVDSRKHFVFYADGVLSSDDFYAHAYCYTVAEPENIEFFADEDMTVPFDFADAQLGAEKVSIFVKLP